jgi:hypothetical protein
MLPAKVTEANKRLVLYVNPDAFDGDLQRFGGVRENWSARIR